MKKLTVFIILLVSFFLTAMSDDGNNKPTVVKKELKSAETVKDHFGVDTEMTKEEYEQFKKDYYKYQKTNKIAKGNRPFNTKINLLEVGKFKKYGISLKKSLDDCNLNDFIIRSELIIVGTFDSVEIAKEKKSRFPITYKVKVNEVISNGTEYEAIPDYITVKGMNWDIPFDQLKKMKEGLVSKGERHVMFLSRADIYEFKNAYDDNKTKYYVDDDCFAPYTFINLYNSLRKLKDERFKDMNKFKAIVKEIDDLNDKKNFYKRSYR